MSNKECDRRSFPIVHGSVSQEAACLECPFCVSSETSPLLPSLRTQPRSHLVGNFVTFEKPIETRKLHRFTLDDDEVHPFSSLFEQLRSARDLLVVQSR